MNKYLAYLHHIGLTQRNLYKFFESNSNFKYFFENFNFSDLKNSGIQEEKCHRIIENRKNLSIKRIDDILVNLNVRLISFKDIEYPEHLKNIPNFPFIIYVRGNLRSDLNLISIVGSRKSTKYSETVLEKFIPDLIDKGYGIVSGGAYGVDSLSHRITMKNSGYTISVSGTGIDTYYPYLNRQLFEDIIKSGGAILSIFPILGEVGIYNFPIRNEIIAGISSGTLITEAGIKSGTLITATLALELNKDVFVIPGDITKESSSGSNKLIQNGLGKLVTCTNDIFEEYITENKQLNLFSNIENKKIEFSDEIEEKIYLFLKEDSNIASVISQKLDLDIDIVNMKLSILEINGIIKLDWGGIYRT